MKGPTSKYASKYTCGRHLSFGNRTLVILFERWLKYSKFSSGNFRVDARARTYAFWLTHRVHACVRGVLVLAPLLSPPPSARDRSQTTMWWTVLLLIALASSNGKRLGGMFQHFCFLQSDAQVFCFGNNNLGALGVGTRDTVSFPTQMLNIQGAMDVAAGQFHSCVVDQPLGRARCTGDNSALALGHPNLAWSNVLVDVHSLGSKVQQVFAGFQHSCALSMMGKVKCWGINSQGELGDGTRQPRSTPVDLVKLDLNVAMVALGVFHTCLLVSGTGQVYCHGINTNGQLGDGTTRDRLEPGLVLGGLRATSISAGAVHSCAVSIENQVFCWGNDDYGQLGQGDRTLGQRWPVLVFEGTFAMQVWSGFATTLVIKLDGSGALGFGENSFGQLGTGNTRPQYLAQTFAHNRSGVVDIKGGTFTTCILDQYDNVECVGDNTFGQLGRGMGSPMSLVLAPVSPTGVLVSTVEIALVETNCGTVVLGSGWLLLLWLDFV
ncbi:hypothetical protein BASA81_001954 [Batrachochytrium salamandrivorans]|nr:hypothetical protein BASA81_001954 [Batrachochytrium salamandrivorans]